MAEPVMPEGIAKTIGSLSAALSQLQAKHAVIAGNAIRLERELAQSRLQRDGDTHKLLTGHYSAATSALNAVDSQIASCQAKLLAQHQLAKRAMRPADKLMVKCPSCGSEVSPSHASPAGKGRRKGSYDCLNCESLFSASWSGGAEPDVRFG